MPCGYGRLEVIEAAWTWLFGGTRCSVDVVDVKY